MLGNLSNVLNNSFSLANPAPDPNKNEERVVITKKEFRDYQTKFFKKLETIEKFLEVMVKDKSAAQRTAIESDVEENQSRSGEPQRDDRNRDRRNNRPGLAAAVAFIVGAIVGKFEEIVTAIRQGFDDMVAWINERIQAITDFVNGIAQRIGNAASGAAQNLIRAAPAALAAGPIVGPAILGAAAASGAASGAVREPTVPSRSPEPDLASPTSMPTPTPPSIGGTPPRQRIPRQGGVAPGVRPGSARQRRMSELAQSMGYTVTSAERNWGAGGAGGHQGGFAIDLRPLSGQGEEPTREELADLWSRFRHEFNMPVDVLYEPHGHGRSTGNHIHVEVHPSRANDTIRFGSERVEAPTTPRVQEIQTTTPEPPSAPERAPPAPRNFPKSLEKSADEYDTDVKQVVLKHPPQTVTENKVMESPREKEYAPKHIDLRVRNPFDGINAVREQASTVKW